MIKYFFEKRSFTGSSFTARYTGHRLPLCEDENNATPSENTLNDYCNQRTNDPDSAHLRTDLRALNDHKMTLTNVHVC